MKDIRHQQDDETILLQNPSIFQWGKKKKDDQEDEEEYSESVIKNCKELFPGLTT